MCSRNDNGEGSSDPAPRPWGSAYRDRSSVGRQHVGQDQRDRHEEQHDTPKVGIDLPQHERAHSQNLTVVIERAASTSASTSASSLSPKAFPYGMFHGEIQQP